MKKTAIVLNWIMLGLFGITFLTMSIQYPRAVSGRSLLMLLPYAAALLAFKTGETKMLIGGSLALNGSIIVVGAAYGLAGILMGEPLKAIGALAILLPPPVLNCIVLKWAWNRVRARARLSQPQAEQQEQ